MLNGISKDYFLISDLKEERDAYIGQIFGLFIIGRAVCLAKNQKNVNKILQFLFFYFYFKYSLKRMYLSHTIFPLGKN